MTNKDTDLIKEYKKLRLETLKNIINGDIEVTRTNQTLITE